MIKLGSKLKILKTANKATALLPNGQISKVASAEDNSEYSNDFLYFIARALTANVPNANGDYFPEDELQKSYQSFIGKNLHLNHDADDVAKAVGKIIDAWFVKNEDDIYVVCLCKIDKTLHPELARNIETGIIDSVSMGCSCQECECSICGCKAHNESEMCDHLKNYLGREITVDGKTEKVSSINRGITFNELSLVGDPADSNAHMYQVYASKKQGDNMNKKAMQDGKTEDVVQEEVKQEIEKTLKDKEETKAEEKEGTTKAEVKEEIKEVEDKLKEVKEIVEEKKEELKDLKEDVKDIKEEKKEEEQIKKEESCKKEEECKKAETTEEIKDIEEIKEKAEEAVKEDKEKSETETKEETKEEIVEEKVEDKKEEEKVETVEDAKEKVEEIKEEIQEEIVAEIGDLFTPVKDETKEFVITDIYEDNGEKFLETEVEGKKKVYALKNVKVKKNAKKDIWEVDGFTYDTEKEAYMAFEQACEEEPNEIHVIRKNDEEIEVSSSKNKNVKLKKKAKVGWNAEPENEEEEIAVKIGDEIMEADFTCGEEIQEITTDNRLNPDNKEKNAAKLAELEEKRKKAVEDVVKKYIEEFKNEEIAQLVYEHLEDNNFHTANSIVEDFVDNNIVASKNKNVKKQAETPAKPTTAPSAGMKWVFNKNTNAWEQKPENTKTVEVEANKEYKYTLIKASAQPRWLVIDKETNKIAQKLYLNDLPKEAESFNYKTVIAKTVAEFGLAKVASKLTKKAIKVNDKYELILEGQEPKTLVVENIYINEDAKETFIKTKIDGSDTDDNIFSESKFLKMIEEGAIKKAEIVEEVKEEVVETAENKVEMTEDTVQMNQDETAEPLNDLQSARLKEILKAAKMKHYKGEDTIGRDRCAAMIDFLDEQGYEQDGEGLEFIYLPTGERKVFEDYEEMAEFIIENYGRKKSSKETNVGKKASFWEVKKDETTGKYYLESPKGKYEDEEGHTYKFNSREDALEEIDFLDAEHKYKKEMKPKKKADAGDGVLVPQSDPTPNFKLAPEVKPNETNVLEVTDVKKDIIKKEITPMEEIANLMNVLQIKLSEVDDQESKLEFVKKEIQDAIDYVAGKPIEEIENDEEEIAEFSDIKWEESDNAELPMVANVVVDDINWNNINAKKDGATILAHIYNAKPVSYKLAFKKSNKMNKTAAKITKVAFVDVLKAQIESANKEVETMRITAQIKAKKEECAGIVKEAMAKGLVQIDSEEIKKNILKGMSQAQAREMAVRKAADEQVKNLMAMDKSSLAAYKETVANFTMPTFKPKAQSIGRIIASCDYDEEITQNLPWSRKR